VTPTALCDGRISFEVFCGAFFASQPQSAVCFCAMAAPPPPQAAAAPEEGPEGPAPRWTPAALRREMLSYGHAIQTPFGSRSPAPATLHCLVVAEEGGGVDFLTKIDRRRRSFVSYFQRFVLKIWHHPPGG